MICITEIKTVDVDRNFIQITRMENIPAVAPIVGSDQEDYAEVKIEMVHGREFINQNGQRVCIGMTQQVQDLIGLPFDAFNNMEKELESNYVTISQLHSRSTMYQKKTEEYEQASFFKRLQYLFVKVF